MKNYDIEQSKYPSVLSIYMSGFRKHRLDIDKVNTYVVSIDHVDKFYLNDFVITIMFQRVWRHLLHGNMQHIYRTEMWFADILYVWIDDL